MQQYTKNENPNINQWDILFLIYLNEKLSGISQFIQGDSRGPENQRKIQSCYIYGC